MPDEDTVAKIHAAADEAVTGDFAVTANADIFLDLNECADSGSVTDRASVEINEVRLVNDHVLPESYVTCYHLTLCPLNGLTRYG